MTNNLDKRSEMKTNIIYFIVSFLFIVFSVSIFVPDFFRIKYDANLNIAQVSSISDIKKLDEISMSKNDSAILSDDGLVTENGIRANGIQSIKTPVPLKALYMTSWVAGTPSVRNNIINLIDESEINAVVIDIKDYTGKIAFKTGNPEIDSSPCIENRVRDIESLLKTFKDKGVYVIGRISVFQDPCFVKNNPSVAVRRLSDNEIWKDNKGLTWVDMGSKDAWEYNVKLARATYELGFDEINFDYVRYPSDGNMRDISFISGNRPKSEVFKSFFEYLDRELRGGKALYGFKNIEVNLNDQIKSVSPNRSTSTSMSQKSNQTNVINMPISTTTRRVAYAIDPVFDEFYRNILDGKMQDRVVVSADLFGMTTTNKDDLGIGQILEYALPYVDFVYPMVYPSHYPAGWNGLKNPASEPYKVIKWSMQGAIDKAQALGLNKQKLRPWLQDFNLGAIYNADMVRQQIRATDELGLDGWLMWNASNRYTREAITDNR